MADLPRDTNAPYMCNTSVMYGVHYTQLLSEPSKVGNKDTNILPKSLAKVAYLSPLVWTTSLTRSSSRQRSLKSTPHLRRLARLSLVDDIAWIDQHQQKCLLEPFSTQPSRELLVLTDRRPPGPRYAPAS